MENEALILARAFSNARYRKGLNYIFNVSYVKKTKFWPMFMSVVEKFGNDKDWDAKNYVDFCFDNYDIKWPFEISKQSIFKDFKERIKITMDLEKEITMDILNSFNIIKKWYSEKKSINTFKDFSLFVEENKLWYNKISPHMIVISSTMRNNLTKNNNDSIISTALNDLRFLRTLKVYSKLRELFPDEIQ